MIIATHQDMSYLILTLLKKQRKNMKKFIKIIHSNYIFYVIFGIILFIPIFMFSGFRGIKESYIDNRDLSYTSYLKSRKSWYK